MDKYAGNHVVRGAAIGGGLGLLSRLTLILYANADETRELKVNEVALLGGLTGLYGLVGPAIGSAFSTWKRVPLYI